jgi:phosphoglucomutase
MYVDSYINDPAAYATDAQVALQPLVQLALKLSQLTEFTGREKPTVIT